MNLYLRLAGTLLRVLFESGMSTNEHCRQWFRVLPNDIDYFGHMNNGRYLQIMDVARMRWMVRTGVVSAMRRCRWGAVLGGNMTRYRHPLHLFDRYCVETRLLCWDARWFYLEHRFINTRGQQVTVGLSRAALRGCGRWIGTDEVMAEVDPGAISGEILPHIQRWNDVDMAMQGHSLITTPGASKAPA